MSINHKSLYMRKTCKLMEHCTLIYAFGMALDNLKLWINGGQGFVDFCCSPWGNWSRRFLKTEALKGNPSQGTVKPISSNSKRK